MKTRVCCDSRVEGLKQPNARARAPGDSILRPRSSQASVSSACSGWRLPGCTNVVHIALLCLVAASEAPRADRRRLEAYNYQVAKLSADAAADEISAPPWRSRRQRVGVTGDVVMVPSTSSARPTAAPRTSRLPSS